ncbi:hypothetical protein [Candidatus Protochlamydia phocaeensis]|uniref:hypothetical protein n=1 Tax=Candidatus Protochlamydia phocaeensis TaxID=1414722 RepID=UPI0008382BE3|nr:hypothetical protein [Candidatus Protochlamydia phocaeensis]
MIQDSFLIPNFFQTVQQDFTELKEAFSNSSQSRNELQQEKVNLAAIRMFASLMMGLGAIKTLVALTFVATAPIGAILGMALGVGLYAIGHDVFIMARKRTQELDNPVIRVGNLVIGLVHEVQNVIRGAPSQPGQGVWVERTRDTLLRPIWLALFNR